MNKVKQKELIVEIMSDDQKDGIYDQNKKTAVEWLYDLSKKRELDRFDLELAKEMEKKQIINAWMAVDNELQRLAAEQYYNEEYGNKESDKCCTPKGQIKRYIDCIGCDKNPKNNIKL